MSENKERIEIRMDEFESYKDEQIDKVVHVLSEAIRYLMHHKEDTKVSVLKDLSICMGELERAKKEIESLMTLSNSYMYNSVIHPEETESGTYDYSGMEKELKELEKKYQLATSQLNDWVGSSKPKKILND